MIILLFILLGPLTLIVHLFTLNRVTFLFLCLWFTGSVSHIINNGIYVFTKQGTFISLQHLNCN